MAFATTDQEYYENSEHWGENQSITLENVIDNIMASADEDSYFKHTSRPKAEIFGKQGMKRLNVDLKSENKAISIQLSPSRTFPYPRFMTNWSRISVLNKCEKLTTLNINNRPEILDYLQDHEWELIYDWEGNIIEGSSFDAETGTCNKCCFVERTDDCTNEEFKDSWVKDIKQGNYFEFSEELVDEIIVIEFQSANLDSLNSCDIRVPHVLELTIQAWIKWCLIKDKKNVGRAKINDYWEEYKLEKRRAKPHLADKISFEQILKSINLRYTHRNAQN